MCEPLVTMNQNNPPKNNHNDLLTGFGNTFESEAIPGALPKGRNNPRQVPFDLYAEQLSGTAFTRPRHVNQRTWLYRKQPSAALNVHDFVDTDNYFGGCDPTAGELNPNPMRWQPLVEDQATTQNFVNGMHLVGATGDPAARNGLAIYMYAFAKSMTQEYFYNSDGDLLLVPQQGTLHVRTEVGRLTVAPTQICVLPRGLVFAVDVDLNEASPVYRGYVLEIYKGHFALPELGPIGSNGLANARDFAYPKAWYESDNKVTPQSKGRLYNKFASKIWGKDIETTPLNVVAWHGNYLPYKYDLTKFCAVNSVSYDHLDPSIYTVLTCAGDEPGTALCDFVIFPPRWMSTDSNTFRPPWYHRNVMTEFMGLIHGAYDAKEGFVAGGASLHSCMTPHGPDRVSYDRAVADPCETPTYFDAGLAFMFETSCMLRLSKYALEHGHLDESYGLCWEGLPNRFDAKREGEE